MLHAMWIVEKCCWEDCPYPEETGSSMVEINKIRPISKGPKLDEYKQIWRIIFFLWGHNLWPELPRLYRGLEPLQAKGMTWVCTWSGLAWQPVAHWGNEVQSLWLLPSNRSARSEVPFFLSRSLVSNSAKRGRASTEKASGGPGDDSQGALGPRSFLHQSDTHQNKEFSGPQKKKILKKAHIINYRLNKVFHC